jgi:hypothetical protein
MGTLSFGYLVNPQDAEEVSELIINYAENHELYRMHSMRGKNLKRNTIGERSGTHL